VVLGHFIAIMKEQMEEEKERETGGEDGII